MLNLKAVPLWLVITAEVVVWLALGYRMWCVSPVMMRRRLPLALAVGIALLNVDTGIQGGFPRTAAWMALVVCVSLGTSTIGKKTSKIFFEYAELKNKNDPRSNKMNANSLLFMVKLMLASGLMLALSAIFVRGITIY